MAERYKAVLFDLDGVLINSYDAWFHLFNRALDHFGFPTITEPVFRAHWGQSTKKDIEIFMPGRTVNEVRTFFTEHYQEYLSLITLNTDAPAVLQCLYDEGLLLGCVTNSHSAITDSILHKHAIRAYFTVVLTADDVQFPKPAPDLLLDACRHLQVTPQQAIFVGDTPTDIKAGTLAGCFMIGYRVCYPRAAEDLLQVRDMILQHVDKHK